MPLQGSGAYLQVRCPPKAEVGEVVQMPNNAGEYAARLYGALHALDAHGYDWIAVDAPPSTPEWEAVLDRLRRAATSDT